MSAPAQIRSRLIHILPQGPYLEVPHKPECGTASSTPHQALPLVVAKAALCVAKGALLDADCLADYIDPSTLLPPRLVRTPMRVLRIATFNAENPFSRLKPNDMPRLTDTF